MLGITASTLRTKRMAVLIAIVAGVAALALRWYYVMHAQVLQPIDLPNARADAVDYYRYAWNLVNRGTFATDLPGSTTTHPDSFRDPGYPLMLAAWLRAIPEFGDWYGAVLLTQALLGALTVSLLLIAVRNAVPNALLAIAALLLCVWPHSISMTSFVLSETLVGFLCAAAFVAIRTAMDHGDSTRRYIAAGSIIGLAGLTNAVIVPFGVLAPLALYFSRRLSRKHAVALAASALLLPSVWGLRSFFVSPTESATGRATMNLAQGSWPNYHTDYQLSAKGDATAVARMQLIDDDVSSFRRSTSEGLHRIVSRMTSDPIKYLVWYGSKPTLLWGWDIRIGQGDIYVYPTKASPFKELPVWKAVLAGCFLLNPFLLLLSGIGAVYSLVRPLERSGIDLAYGTLFVMVTAIYGVLQSEPRYSIPYKGIEVILAVMAVHRLSLWYRQRLRVGSQDGLHANAIANRLS